MTLFYGLLIVALVVVLAMLMLVDLDRLIAHMERLEDLWDDHETAAAGALLPRGTATTPGGSRPYDWDTAA